MKNILLFLCLLTSNVRASHVVAGTIWVNCISRGATTDICGLNLTVDRDCGSTVVLGNYASITVSSVSCNQSQTITVNATTPKPDELDLACLPKPTTCGGGAGYGVQYWTYYGTVSLTHCKDWVFSFSNCCRNAAITTVTNSSTYQIFIYATLDNTDVCVDSPSFNSLPVVIVCLNTDNVIQSKITNNGDSVTFKLVNPKSSSSVKVPYHAGYDSTHFLKGTINFSASSGDIIINPTSLEISIYAIQVSEYINGKVVATIMRDVQILTVNSSCCTSDPLPVNLLYFTAKKDHGVKLSWATASETDNECFLISKSKDLFFNQPFARVNSANGNCSTEQYYELSDTHPFNGLSYYRLTQVDRDGKQTNFSPIAIKYKSNEYHGDVYLEDGRLLKKGK